MVHDIKLSLVCLGTGKGASMVYDGNCSPGYVLCVNEHPILLLGAGYGVTRQCLRYFGIIPSNIFIFSNRSHMSAELPVIIAVESHKGRRLQIISEKNVMSRLRQHRLAEVQSRINLSLNSDNGICDFISLESIPGVSPYHLLDNPDISLKVFHTPATETSCGIVIMHHNISLLAVTGDCAFEAECYDAILHMAPIIILDGRLKGSCDHASFTDIFNAVKRCNVAPQLVFIAQYGQPWEAPAVDRGGIVLPIVEGSIIALDKNISLMDTTPNFEVIPSRNGETDIQLEGKPRKVYFINNDSPDTPPALLMVQNFRNMTQVKQRVSELLHIRPIGELFCAETSQKIKNITQFTHGMQVIATRIGGRPFESVLSNLNEKEQRLIMKSKSIKNISNSMELNEYMQRAHRILQKPINYEVNINNTNNNEESLNNDYNAFNISQSVITAELSPETPLTRHSGEVLRKESSVSAPGYSFRFTTMQT